MTATLLPPRGDVSPSPTSRADVSGFETGDVISPELCLIDPELAERARALLPSYENQTQDGYKPRGLLIDHSVLQHDEPRVISPELALVDPELAEWARARLPKGPPYFVPARNSDDPRQPQERPAQPQERPAVQLPPARDGVVPEPGSELVEPREPPPPPLQLVWGFVVDTAEDRASANRGGARELIRRAAKVAGTAAAAAALLAAGLFVAYAMTRSTQNAPAAADQVTSGAVRAAEVSSATALTDAHTSFRAPHLSARAPARRLTWARVSSAAAYDVRLYRNGRGVFAARTTHRWIVFPRLWTAGGRRTLLGPGAYTCYVRPLFRVGTGLRIGPPIVDLQLTLPAAR